MVLKYTALDRIHLPTYQRIEAYQSADCEAEIAGLRIRWRARGEDFRKALEQAREIFGG